MKAAKIYALIWLIVLVGSGVFYWAGLLNEITLPIFAFIVWTVIAMGFIGVLPAMLNKHFVPKP